jgi:hypothetical protein
MPQTSIGLGYFNAIGQAAGFNVPLSVMAQTQGNIMIANGSAWVGRVMGGDATLAMSGALIVTKTRGVAFGTMATLDAGVAGGGATLDSTGALTAAQIPSSLLTGSEFQGLWNASTNSPPIASGVGTTGDYWFVSVAGTTNIDGNASWSINDQVIFDGAKWDRIPAQSGSVGTGIVDFGSTPTMKTAIAVVPASQVMSDSKIEAFFQADDRTASNTANAHQVAGALMRLSCGARVPGVGFSVFADPLWGRVTGSFVFSWTIG